MKNNVSDGISIFGRSSIYGASLIASEFNDSLIVIWGPRGCTSQMLEAMIFQRQQYEYYHFPVSETDILTNGISTLKKYLLPLVAGSIMTGPMFLLLGDAPQLTTEDVEGVVDSNISQEYPVVFVETGFKGDHYYGINETLYKTVKRLCREKRPTRHNVVNLIPEVGMSPQWRGDAIEIARILKKIGFDTNILPNRLTIDQVANFSEASCTILLNPNIGRKAAEYFKENFNIPVFVPANMPIGLLGTRLWLEEFMEFSGKSSEDIRQVINEENIKFFTSMRPALREENYNVKVNILRKSKFLVCDEQYRALQWCRMLTEEYSFSGGYVFPTSSLGEEPDAATNDNIRIIDDIPALISCCESEETVLVFGSDWINELIGRDHHNKVLCINSPVVKKITFSPRPYFGFNGALNLLEDSLNSIIY